MAESAPQSGNSRRTSQWTFVLVFLAGFLSGVVLTAYKTREVTPMGSGPGGSVPGRAPSPGNVDAMAEALRNRADEQPDDPAPWAQLGHLYFDAGRFAEAIDAYGKALERDPENADLWTDFGVMHRRAGNPQRAIESFDRAIALDPRHEISRFNRGIVLMHDLDREADALRAWEELADINPVFATADGRTLDELIRQYGGGRSESENNL